MLSYDSGNAFLHNMEQAKLFYSAFDITQNFDLNIMSWKQVKVYPSLLNDNNILFDESYFFYLPGYLFIIIRIGNKVIARRMRMFTGCKVIVRISDKSESTVEAKNGNLEYNLTITNTGFATVINPKELHRKYSLHIFLRHHTNE